MSDKKITGYRGCRAQRCSDGLFRFTLPLDTKTFGTARGAFEHCKLLNAFKFADNYFDIQEMYSDGTFSEYPKPLHDLGLDVPKEPEPIEERPVIVAEPSEENFKVDSSLIAKRKEQI